MVTNPSPHLLSQLSARAVAALKDKWTIPKVARLETSEIVSRLEKLGIEQALAYPVVDADDWDLDVRLDDLRENLRVPSPE